MEETHPVHQPVSAEVPQQDSFDYPEHPQRRFTMNPHEQDHEEFMPQTRKRVQSDASMFPLHSHPTFEVGQQEVHPMDDYDFNSATY